MNFRTLIRRSLWFHWRAHLGVVLGAAAGSAALIGALVVGDSVRESLRERALERLGEVHAAISSGDRFFLADLGSILHETLRQGWWNTNDLRFSAFLTAPATALSLTGAATRQDGTARANQVSLVGFSKVEISSTTAERRPFFRLRHTGSPCDVKQGEVLLNERLALQLRANVGDQII